MPPVGGFSVCRTTEISGHTLRDVHPEWAYEILVQEGFPPPRRKAHGRGDRAGFDIGREYPVLQAVLSHLGAQGEVEFVSTICRDISDHKQRELERIEWANRYNAAIRASGQVVFDWDTLSGEIMYGGDMEKLLGFSVAEMSGGMERLRQEIHPEDLASFDERIEVATMTRDPFDQLPREAQGRRRRSSFTPRVASFWIAGAARPDGRLPQERDEGAAGPEGDSVAERTARPTGDGAGPRNSRRQIWN